MIVGSLLTNKQLDIYIRHAVSCCRVFDLQIKEKYTTMSNIAIEFEHVSKQYRLGLVSTKTLSHDIRRFWITNVLGKEDPYLKIGC